jgi:hypothetical protein
MDTPENEPKFVTCPCLHCNGHIEFDTNQLDRTSNPGGMSTGLTVPCPHCGLETMLYILPPAKPSGLSKIITLCPTFTRWLRALSSNSKPKKKTPPPAVKTPPPRITPAIPKGLQCPFCHSYGDFLPRQVMTTGGWITMIIGGLLTPFCIGIFLFFISLTMKEQKYFCCNCKKLF